MAANTGTELLPGDLKDCNNLPIFGRTLDVGELLYHDPSQDDKESLTKFNKYDHKQHDLCVEEHVLTLGKRGRAWKEISRWVKYEETLEQNGTRFGKPHVPALNFHSIINLRRALEAGVLIFDCDDRDMETLSNTILESLSETVDENDLPIVEKSLMSKHRHVIDSEKMWTEVDREFKTGSAAEMGGLSNFSTEGLRSNEKLSHLLRIVPKNAEGGLVLVGRDNSLKGLTVVFVRLSEGILMPNITEMPVPVRFVFLLLGPSACEINYVELGQCMGVLLSNSIFRHIAYQARERRDILVGLNEFLDAGILLPHGNWDNERFHLADIKERGRRTYERKRRHIRVISTVSTIDQLVVLPRIDDDDPKSPFKRMKTPFGGVINDITRRYPMYLSDITDAFNVQCLATIIFLYFATVSGGIAMGQLLRNTTDGYIGIPETLLGSAIAGVIFALFSGQPILFVTATGPTLVFDESLYKFCAGQGLQQEFLAMRFWIGIWTALIALVVVGAEGSVVARFVTRFTQEIFAVFISVVFTWESLKAPQKKFSSLAARGDKQILDSGEFFIDTGILLLTFSIAWTFRAFKTSTYGTNLLRKLLGNFGTVFTIIIASFLAYLVTPFNPKKNLELPDAIHEGLHPTLHDPPPHRFSTWLVDPTALPVAWIFGAILPAVLLFLLVFLELSIGELIMNRKESLLKKGSGLHLDVLLVCFINALMGFLGTNWVSSGTLRSLTHLVALTVYSTDNPPGEKPKIIGTREQRVTAFVANILGGCSVVMGYVLQFVPMSVLMGIFLYMGISAISGIQFTDRICLFFKQIDKHPEVLYVKRVRTWKMHVYTLIQIISLAIIWGIKISSAALILPFVFILLIPLRKFMLTRYYDSVELEALDGFGADTSPAKEPLKTDVTPSTSIEEKSEETQDSTATVQTIQTFDTMNSSQHTLQEPPSVAS